MTNRLFNLLNKNRGPENSPRSHNEAEDDFAGLVLGYSRTGPFVVANPGLKSTYFGPLETAGFIAAGDLRGVPAGTPRVGELQSSTTPKPQPCEKKSFVHQMILRNGLTT